MEAFTQPLTDLISRHHEWAAVVLGIATFLESLLLIGAFVPATALMLIAGGLIARGVLDPTAVIIACVIGAVLGNAVSYQLGRRLGRGALRHSAVVKHRRLVARTRLFCRQHGTISVYIGRFFGPLRAFVPLVVGALGMRRRTFQTANVISGVLWVLVMLAPGYFAARGLAELQFWTESDGLTLAIAGGVVLVAVAVAVGLRMQQVRRRQRLIGAARRAV